MIIYKLSVDIELIIEACKNEPNSTRLRELIPLIKEWHTFIDLAYTHGIFPVVYKVLKNYAEFIPQEIMHSMKISNMSIVKENMLMSAELIKVMKLLEEHNIKAIAFKGPTLAQLAYGDITLRQYCDLDILIQAKSLQKSYAILLDTYSVQTKLQYLDNDLYIDKLNDVNFFNKSNNILIELHWNLFQKQFSNTLLFADILKSSQKVKIQGYEFSIFSNEVLLLYLCIHGSKHCWERISWILDIDKIIRKNPNLNWDLIEKMAKELQCENMLHLGLSQSEKLFHTPLNYEYKSNKKLNLYIEENFEKLPLSKTEFSINYNSFKFRYMLQDNFTSKIRYLLRTIFPINAQDVTFVQLPTKLYFLYYLIKPFRLSLKYIRKLLNI